MFCSTVEEEWERLLGNDIAWKSDSVQQTTALMAHMVMIESYVVVLEIMLSKEHSTSTSLGN